MKANKDVLCCGCEGLFIVGGLCCHFRPDSGAGSEIAARHLVRLDTCRDQYAEHEKNWSPLILLEALSRISSELLHGCHSILA